MGDIKIDIPDITVVVSKGEEYLASVTPGEVYQVSVNTGDNYNVNLTRPQVVPITADNYFRTADFATSASYAVTASYIAGDTGITDWTEITNKPSGLVSSSTQVNYTQLQNLPSASGTASYVEYVNVVNKPTLVSSSTQIQLNQISGTTFGSSNFTFPQNVTVGGTLTAQTLLVSSSTIYTSGSTKFGDSTNDTHQFTGSVFVYGNVSADNFYGTASIASNISVINAGFFETSSASYIIPTPSGGLSYVTSASYATTASHATTANINGSMGYIPKWNTATTLTESAIYQTGSSVLINSITQHTPEAPDTLGIYAGVTDSYNAVSAHGTSNNYLQTNIKNFSGGASASSDVVATADIGSESDKYIDMGINNSGYALSNFVGGPLDAYLYSAGNELLIGNITQGYGITFFTGGPNITGSGRMFINEQGVIGMNTKQTTTGNPETLYIRAINNNTYNLITAKSNVDAYSQLNIQNESSGSYASSDIVTTADNGDEFGNFINIGINGSQYTGDFIGDYGNANDAYLYSTGSSKHLHVGEASPDGQVTIFAGSTDFESTTKLRVRANNQHELTGSLNVSSNVVAVSFTGSLLATNGVVSSSSQISQAGFVSSSTINTIEVMTSASYAAITPVSGTLYVIVG